jgi:serine/threonine protein kinase/WD40 repeat protein
MSREVELFEQALEIVDDHARSIYLQNACANDPGLLERLQRLFTVHDQTGDFMTYPAPLELVGFQRPSSEPHQPGEKFGPYELVEILGRGGMSVVWRARQVEPVRRDVAIKLLHQSPRSLAHSRRARSEIHALALMQHSNVAMILDAGQTERAELFLVIELVEGQPITEYCHQRGLSLEDRLRLVLQICNGVQHAHQRGIIHCDLKPSNLLAFEQDSRAQVKIIDFGIAKLIDPDEAVDSSTLAGQMIGTPQYMSPEQSDSASQSVDIRADVYALGVVIYELLTGKLPYSEMQPDQQSASEIFRILQQSPVTPLAQRGPATSLKLAQLPIDLNWLTNRCLNRDPAERYQSVGHLADDICHFLDGRPLSAGPPTMKYRLSKWLKRHRGATAMIATLLTVMFLATAISLGFAISASRARHRAVTAAQDVSAANKLAQSRLLLAQAERARTEEALIAELRQREETEFRSYAAYISAADSALKDYDTFEAVTNLSDAPEKYRSFEWWYLLAQVDHSIRSFGGFRNRTQTGHQGEVTQVCFHPDKNWLMTGGSDGTIIVWEVESAVEVSRLSLGSPIVALRWRPGRESAAAWLKDGRLLLLSLEKKQQPTVACSILAGDNSSQISSAPAETRAGRDPKDAILALEWSLDGMELFAVRGTNGNTLLRQCDISANLPMEVLNLSAKLIPENTAAAAIHPNGLLALACGDRLMVKSLESDQPMFTVDLLGDASKLAFSPSADQLAICIGKIDIGILDIPAGKFIKTFTAHDQSIRAMQYSPDGKWLASASDDGTLRTWRTDGFQLASSKWGHVRAIADVAFSPDSSLIATAGRLCAKTWSCRTLPSLNLGLEPLLELELQHVQAAAGSSRVLIKDRVNRLFAGDLNGRNGLEIPLTNDGSSSSIRDVGISTDGQKVAWCDGKAKLHLFMIESQVEKTIGNAGASFVALAFSNEHLYACDETGTVWRSSTNGDGFEQWWKSATPIRRLIVSRDGSTLVVCGSNHLVIINGLTSRELHRQPRPEDWLARGGDLAISDDGKVILASTPQPAGYQGYDFLSFWSADKGWLNRLPSEHTRNVCGIAWSHDNRRFATSSEDRTIKIWDREKLQVVLTLRTGADVCRGLTFSERDLHLIGVDEHGKLMSWSTRPHNRPSRSGNPRPVD